MSALRGKRIQRDPSGSLFLCQRMLTDESIVLYNMMAIVHRTNPQSKMTLETIMTATPISTSGTNYTICSKGHVRKLGQRGGGAGGVKYPWFDAGIGVGGGFFVERTQTDLDKGEGRPNFPKSLKESSRQFRTYKAEMNGKLGYYCERIR